VDSLSKAEKLIPSQSSRSIPSQMRSILSVPNEATCNLFSFHILVLSAKIPAIALLESCARQSFFTFQGVHLVS
jgi:hypothetical protein